ncbi:MAG: DUF6268 family outer membrane beta-barrel protein [Bacteroidia bacterium]|nr:DUF6268 family outer membrane beta-barrel protein [Bacteroidia bacterium]
MKFKFILMIMMTFLSGYAQNYIDLVHTEYTNTPQNNFKDQSIATDSNTSRVAKTHINLTIPIQLKNKNALISGIVFDQIDTRFWGNTPSMPVSSVIVKAGMNIVYSDKWSATYILLPKLASSFNEEVNRSDFQLGALGLVKKKRNEFLTYKFGAYMNGDLFGPFLVPLFGFYYQKNNWEMDVIIPSYAKINYTLSPKVTTGINWRATVKSYNLNSSNLLISQDNLYMHHLSNEVGAHLSYEPIKGIIIRAISGLSLGRSFRIYKNEDKIDFGLSLFRFGDNRKQLNTDFENGQFHRLELCYRVYLD